MAGSTIIQGYSESLRRKIHLFVFFLIALAVLAVFSVGLGSFDMSPLKVVAALFGYQEGSAGIVIWNIRMPRIISAIVAGWGLGVSGAVMQCLLRNPLGSPFTLGISHGAAFGAAFAIVVLGAGGTQYGALRTTATSLLTVSNVYAVTLCAFAGAMVTTAIILLLARMKQMAPESIILADVALSSLFVSGTILIQYFASEVELASIVFWTFGDVSRSNWNEIGIMTAAVIVGTAYFIMRQWDFNALSAGEDTAKGLGVEVERVRLWGMFMAAFVAALIVAFHGVIAFLGLLAPHIGRRLVGADHRVLLVHSCVLGALLLLLADTLGRVLVGSGTLPVGVLTSFMGAPLFLYLLIGGRKG